jgi:hypothetical protein
LKKTPQKWRTDYFGDFEAPLTEYPVPSPSPSPTPSITPSITPSVSLSPQPTTTPTPTSTNTPTPTLQTPTPTPTSSSVPVTPTPTPSITASITPSVTPTFTPTPSSTPPEAFYLLAEDGDELLTEGSDNLIVESGWTSARVVVDNLDAGIEWVVTNNTTSTELLRHAGVDDSNSTGVIQGAQGINQYTIEMTRYVGGSGIYFARVYQLNGNGKGDLLYSSPSSSTSISFTFTAQTAVYIECAVPDRQGLTTIQTQLAPPPFSKFGDSYTFFGSGRSAWAVSGINWYSSTVYRSEINSGTGIRKYLIRTSQSTWTRYNYQVATRTWSSSGTETSSLPINTRDCETLLVPC